MSSKAAPVTNVLTLPEQGQLGRASSSLDILLIEDNPGDVVLIRAMLEEIESNRLNLDHAATLAEGLGMLDSIRYAAVITDLNLPDSAGMDTLDRLVEEGDDLPVIVLTHCDDDPAAIEMVKRGAQDYLVKGRSDGALIEKTVRYAIERKLADRHLAFLSHHDRLTGLANRELFQDRLEQAMARAERDDNLIAVLFLDVDRFKSINDTLGHKVGDELLCIVAEKLGCCIRKVDTLARLGGDEFTIVLEGCDNPFDAELVCRKVTAIFEEPVEIQGQEIFVTMSIGVTFYPTDATEMSSLLRNADTAMYRAKEDGRNNYHLFTTDLNVQSIERLSIESALRHAIERDELRLYYQPKVDLTTGATYGVEALIRWQNPHRGLVSPLDFIPIAEETGLIVPIGEWVLRRAVQDALLWQAEGLDLSVAVNLSARQFRQSNLVETVEKVLSDFSFEANRLELEITESLLMQDTEASQIALNALKRAGSMIHMDDFGTGYSSLAYLKKFPIDALKIDRSFVRDLPGNSDDEAIARAIIALGQALRLKVLAEGVETEQQLAFLRAAGCDQVQGYFFAKPLPYNELIAWCKARD